MAPMRARFGAPRRLMLSFILLLILPAGAVVWLGVQLLRQDRDLEIRQRQERRELAADRFVAMLDQLLSSTERNLRSTPAARVVQPDDDAMVLTIRGTMMDAWPRRGLLYQPTPSAVPPPAFDVFDGGETLEYRLRAPAAAAAAFRRLAASGDANIRAGALLRLARNLRRVGQVDEALRTYGDLASLDRAILLGLPADLVARRARCALLDEAGRDAELRAEAEALLQDLLVPKWTVDRGTFDAYVAQLERWLGRTAGIAGDRLALSAAAAWLRDEHGRGVLPAAGRRALHVEGTPVTLVWQSPDTALVALIAGPRFQQRAWFGAFAGTVRGFAPTLADDEGRIVFGAPPADAGAVVKRRPPETGLPWALAVADTSSDAAADAFARRRRTLLAGLSFVLILVLAGGYAVARAVSREFAVARLQTDFVAAVSHEFRTPLTSLHQFTALLNDDVEPPPEKRRLFYRAQARAAERLRRLVESLLDFGRMEAGARPYRLERIDAGALVRGVATDFQKEVEGQGFTITCSISPDAVVAEADADALTRALWNLLDNAVKYSGPSRRVDVQAANRDGAVAIAVRDRGFGIPGHEQREIFEKFVRGEASRAHGIKGTGIGLAMVRHIVDAHGGHVDVESAPGEGSTFTIVLPARSR